MVLLFSYCLSFPYNQINCVSVHFLFLETTLNHQQEKQGKEKFRRYATQGIQMLLHRFALGIVMKLILLQELQTSAVAGHLSRKRNIPPHYLRSNCSAKC